MSGILIVNGAAALLAAVAAVFTAYTAGSVRRLLPKRARNLLALSALNVAFCVVNIVIVTREVLGAT